MASTSAPCRIEVEPGLGLATECTGSADGPTLILSPGGGQTRHAWRHSARILGAAGFNCVTVDLRGHGESDWSKKGHYSLEHFTSDLITVANVISPHRPVALVGFSLGGMASLQAAALAPGRVASLVLVDVAPWVQIEGAARIHSFMMQHRGGFTSPEEATAAIAAYRGGTGGDPANVAKNLRSAADGRLHWHWDPAFVNALTQGDLGRGLQASRESLERAARRVQQPTLLVRGMSSDVITMDSVAALRRLMPQLEFADVADAGHMVVAERNDAFCDAMLGFLSQTMSSR